MEEKEKLVYDNFVRQRRNLMAISLVLFFYISSGIVMDTINILGNSFKVTTPSHVGSILYIVWGYFLLRYYQYFRHMPLAELRTKYAEKMSKIVSVVGVKLFKKGYKTSNKFSLSGIYVFRDGKEWMVSMDVDISDEAQSPLKRNVERINVDTIHLIMPRLKAAFHIAINTRFITEYFLPFLVALLPIFYKGYLFVSGK